MRLFTRNGQDWSGRFPLITEAALRNRNTSFVIDGDAAGRRALELRTLSISICKCGLSARKKPKNSAAALGMSVNWMDLRLSLLKG